MLTHCDDSRSPVDAHDHGAEVAAKHGIARSPRWPEVVRAHLSIQPVCVACARKGARVEVHHVFPFHLCIALGRPDLELDERNLITLCADSDEHGAGDHHLLLGHFDDWESVNARVRMESATAFHGWSAEQLRANEAWRNSRRTGPRILGRWARGIGAR
jgi:hypothetical protein